MGAPPYDPGKALGADNRSYEQYLAERQLLVESERAAGDNFDKVLLALCAGAIALSVTFVEKIGSAGVAKPLLYVAWGLLLAALIANLRSFMVLQLSINRVMEINDALWESGAGSFTNPYRPKIMVLNRWSFRLFVAGILLLLVFAAVNYQASGSESRSKMTDQNRSNQSTHTEVKKSAGGPTVVKLPPPPPAEKNSTGTGPSGGSTK